MFPFQYGELVETRHTVGLLSRFIDKERDGSIRMCTDGTRSRMVGQDGILEKDEFIKELL